MRIPQITSLKTAITIYHTKRELGNKDIRALFGNVSNNTIVKLKELARAIMRREESPTLNETAVNTCCAFEAWGLSIEELETSYKKLRRLGLGD